MSLANLLGAYLTANILLTVAFLLLALLHLGLKSRGISWSAQLRLHYFVVAFVFVLVALQPLFAERQMFTPVARVWSASSQISFSPPLPEYLGGATTQAKIWTPTAAKLSMSHFGAFALVLFMGLLAYSVGRLLRDVYVLIGVRDEAYLVREISGVRIYVSEQLTVPLCFWWPRQLSVILPSSLIASRELRIAILHELQHHRQGDTKWVYPWFVLRVFFCANPAVHFWHRGFSALQEFACDSTLIGRKNIEPLDYASCLVQVAENVIARGAFSAGAAGVAFLNDHLTIHRRIQEMFKENEKTLSSQLSPRAWSAILIAVGGMLSATAFASHGLVQDRRVTRAQAQDMKKQLSSDDTFPVVVNDRVVKWLNYFVGSPEGRAHLKEALVRMEAYRPMIEKRLAVYGLPADLMAIPLIESGYQNLAPSANPVGAAGVWQFMAGTAVNFGLQVDTKLDERLDVEKETDAAFRLLFSDRLRFDNWGLSILGYNSGETFVQQAITQTGSRDPWVIIDSGLATGEGAEYLPKLMAAILIMKNPSSLD